MERREEIKGATERKDEIKQENINIVDFGRYEKGRKTEERQRRRKGELDERIR